MNKVWVKHNSNGDTRAVNFLPEFSAFQEANNFHKTDVENIMFELAREITERGHMHDFTKKSREKEFYNDFARAVIGGKNFTELDWYKMHVSAERHHLNSNMPNDANLIDLLEMIVDCVCAAKTRSNDGSVEIKISSEDLQKILKNTVLYISDNVEVIKDD